MKKILLNTILTLSSVVSVNSLLLAEADDKHLIPEVVMEKIQQCAFPLRTMHLEIQEECSDKNGKFSHGNTYLLKVDIPKNLLYYELKMPDEETSEYSQKTYLSENLVTYVGFEKLKPPSKALRINAGIARFSGCFPLGIRTALTFNSIADIPIYGNSLKPIYPTFLNGKINMQNPVFKRVKYKNEDAIEISSTPTSESGGGRSIYTFSERTGVLLKKRESHLRTKNGKREELWVTEEVMSNFFFNNGILFPETITLTFAIGNPVRYTINKKTAKFNHTIDEKEFIPVIPPNARVHDEIRNVKYITPILGNLEATKELEKELDAYFKSADDVK